MSIIVAETQVSMYYVNFASELIYILIFINKILYINHTNIVIENEIN